MLRISRRLERVLTALLICTAGCSTTGQKPRPAEGSSDSARITQFYATTPATPRGDSATLCYGVDNAITVRIDPPVESLKPALSRCISVSPSETTTYTLTAEGPDKKAVSQSATVTVTGPLPHFVDLSISKKEVAPGEQINFCFKAKNAVKVRGGPGRFLSGGLPQGDCLVDNPRKTTTYSLKIEGAGGETDEDSVTVKVR